MGEQRFRIYIARGRVLLLVTTLDSMSDVLHYFDEHKKESLWFMDLTDMTMRHNSHFR
jgi:hypothetical protein